MQDETDNNNFAIQVRASSTQIKLYIDTTSKVMTFTGTNGDWTIGAWRHVSVQLDSTQRVFMASLMFDFQTSGTYWPQKTGFYFKGDIEFGTSPAFALQELRIWNHFKSWEEIKTFAYTDMSDYHSGLLVSYWRLKPILNLQQLEDSSLNPQLSGTFSGGPLEFGYDESYPVICKYKQVWDYTNKMCINIQASKQKIFKFNNVNSQLLTVDYGKVVVQWNMEFWFKPDLAINPSPILFDHSNMWVAIENSVDFKVYSKPSTSWPHQLQNFTFTKWNHILISFYDDPVDTTTYARYGVCLNYACIDDSVQFVKAGPKTYIVAPNYAGYLKEMRVWDWGDASTQNGFFYYKQQIPHFYQTKVALTDYMRFTWFSSDSDVFRHFMPESVSSFGLSFDSSYIPGGNYAPFLVDILYSDNLQECQMGLKFNGIECTSDSNTLRARQNTHLPIATYNASGPQIPYSIGFYFRLSPKMMNDALQTQDLILIQSDPYYAWGRFFEVKMRDGDLHMLVESGGNWRDMDAFYGSDATYREGFWFYFYHKVGSANYIHTFIIGFLRNLIKEINDGSVNNYNHPTADQTIHFGQNSFSTWDSDFSIRDFHLDQTSGQIYSLDQIFFLSRTRYQTYLISGVQIPFNESYGNYIYDIKRGPAGVFNLRDTSQSDLVWEWDPYVPVMCDGPDTVFLTTNYQLYCGYREVFHFMGGNDQIKLSNIGYDTQITQNHDFTLSFFLRLNADPNYSKAQHILTMNPTQPGSIILRGTHTLYPNIVYWFEMQPVIFGQAVGNASHWCYLEIWCMYRLVKNHENFAQYVNTGQYGGTLYYPGWADTFGNVWYSHAFDNQIWIGGSSGAYEPFTGYLRDLRLFNTVVDYNQMKDELTFNRIPFANGLLSYFSLDIPSWRHQVQNLGPRRFNPPDYQIAATWPKTELDTGINNIGDFNYYNYVQRFRTIDLIDTISFPATSQSEWTLELRLQKIVNYNEPIILINGFIQIDGNLDGSVAITFNGYGSPFNTLSFIQQSEWMQLSFIRRGASATVTEMYVNGVFLMDVPQVCNLPTGNIAWYGAHNYIAIKDIRVWTEALPLTMLNQNQYKELDGRHFPTLQYYLPIRYNYQILTFSRKYIAGQASIFGIAAYALVTNVDTQYCIDPNAVQDGTGCNYYKYIHMKTNELRALDFPIITSGLVPEWTVDFWMLFQKGASAGDIVSVVMQDLSKVRYAEDGSYKINYMLYPIGGGGGVPSLMEQAFDRAAQFSFKVSYWKKLIITYTSTSLTITIDGNTKTQSAKVASGSSRPNRVLFCESNSCNFGLRHVTVWSKAQTNGNPRTPPIFSDIAYLMAYWPLDEGKGGNFYDLSGNQMVYPIDMRNPMQPFIWKFPHQISQQGDHLFLCFDQSTNYNEFLGQCEPMNVPSISYSPSTTPVQLKHNQLQPLSKDWSIEFWLKFTYTTTFSPFTVLTQNQLSCSATHLGAVVLSIGIQQFGATSLFSIKSQDLANARTPNENGHKIIQAGFYFHYFLTNSALQNTLSSTLNFTLSSTATTPTAYDHLSLCDLMLGPAAMNDPNTRFQLKQLRIWNSAMGRDEIMRWGASSIISQGYPNLMLYYRLDNDYFYDVISGVQSPQLETQYNLVADSDFTLGCPVGYVYDFAAKNCMLYDYGEYYLVSAYETWSIEHVLEKEMKDQDSSYTLLIYTYVPNQNISLNILKFGSLLQLRWINVTYVLEIDLGGTAATFTAPYSGAYDYWFITFDFANQKLSIYRNLDELYSTILQHKMVRDWNSVASWIAKVGFDGSSNEYSIVGIKNIDVFRPPLTLAHMTHIVTYNIRSHFPGATGLRGSFRNDYSNLIWTTVSATTTFDMLTKTYIYTSTGYYKSVLYMPGSCMEGTNQYSYNCYEQGNLVIHGGALGLKMTDAVIASSVTVQGWFMVQAYQVVASAHVVTFMSIQDLFKLEYSTDLLTFKIYGQSAVESSTTLPYLVTDILGKWLNLAVVLKNFKWTVYSNKVPIITLYDASQMIYSNVNNLVIATSSIQVILKVREVSVYGHAKDSYELAMDMGSHISQTANYKQLLAYYPMIETVQSTLIDLSQFGRTSTLTSNMYWDFSSRGQHYTQGRMINEISANTAYVTRDKALQIGASGVTKVGVIPAGMASATFTLSAFIAFNSVGDFASTTPILIIQDATNRLVQIEVTSSTYQCLITNDVLPVLSVPIDATFNRKWVFVVCGHSDPLKSSYLHINKDSTTSLTSDLYKLHASATDINPASFSVDISSFNGMLRDLRVYSECLDPYVAVKLGRRNLNLANSVYKLALYLPMDESTGDALYDYASNLNAMLTSSNGILPQWQAAWETLTLCDGHSRYSHEYDFCSFQERFLRFKTPRTLTFTILEDQVQNVTLALWVNFRDFGTTEPSLQLKLDRRFDLTISTTAQTYLFVGDPSSQALFRRDEKYLSYKNWVVLYLRIAYPYQIIYNYVGVPQNTDGDLTFYGNAVNSMPFNFNNIVGGIPFVVKMGTNSEIYLRNLQMWNSPFSLELAKLRILRGLNPTRFEKTLLIYFRFDESGGTSIFNTAPYPQRVTPRVIQDTSLGRDNFEWVHYIELGVNQTLDTETQRMFLFCLEPNSRRVNNHCEYYTCHPGCPINDCIGPTLNDCINQTSLVKPPSPRDTVTMFTDFTQQDCFECNAKCTGCLMAFANMNCTGCVTGLYLLYGVCGTTCPPYMHFIDGDCFGCTNPMCLCTREDLNSCTDCRDPLNIYIYSEQMCYLECPEAAIQYYDRNIKECKYCHDFCNGCTGPTNRDCKLCKDQYILFKGTVCVPKECPPGTFFDEDRAECRDCEFPCATCKGTAANCITCVENYAFDPFGQCLMCIDIEGFDYPWYNAPEIPGGGRCTEICGDGLDFGAYECDDGNTRSGDGCSSRCKIEKSYGCGGGSPKSSDTCEEIRGPSFEIQKIMGSNRYIYLQFDKTVQTDKRNFTKEEIIVVISGVSVKSGQTLNYDISSVVTESLGVKGRLIMEFRPYFSIEKATIQVGFKNQSAIRDTSRIPLTNQLSSPYNLEKYTYIDPNADQGAINTASSAQMTSQITLIVNLVLSLFLGKALDKIWLSLNACQIIYLMPLMNVPYPRKLKIYLKFLEFANMDVKFSGDPFFFKWLALDEVIDKPVSASFQDYDFEQSIFFVSYADKMQVWAMFIGGYPIIKVLTLFLKHQRFDFLRKLEQGYRYNMIIRMITELYLEMTLHAFMNIYSLQYATMTQALVTAMALIFMGGLTYFPALTMAAVASNAHQLDKEETKKRIGELYEETHVIQNKTMNQYWMTMFLFRRLVYVMILVLLKDYPSLQVALCVFKTFAILLFVIINMPFHSKMLNYQHIMNESLTGIAFSVSYVFTQNLDEAQQDFNSFIVLSTVALILGFNIFLVIIDTLQSLNDLLKMVRNKGVLNYLREKKQEMVKKVKNSTPMKILLKKKKVKVLNEDGELVEQEDGEGESSDNMETQDNMIIKKTKQGEILLQMKPQGEPTLPFHSKREGKLKQELGPPNLPVPDIIQEQNPPSDVPLKIKANNMPAIGARQAGKANVLRSQRRDKDEGLTFKGIEDVFQLTPTTGRPERKEKSRVRELFYGNKPESNQ